MVIPALTRAAAGAPGWPAAAGPAVRIVSGPGIGRRAAQQLARRELAKAIYQPPVGQRILNAIANLLSRVIGGAQAHFPGGWWALIAVVALAILVGALVIFWIRPARKRALPGAVLQGSVRRAQDYRREADRLAAAGDFTAAIIEDMRAIAMELEERGVLPPRAGRTAAELGGEAARPFPGLAGELSAAARLFDDLRYGGHAGSASGYERLHALDAQVRTARPAAAPAVSPAGRAAGATASTAPW